VCQGHLEQGQVRIRGNAGIDRDHPLCTSLCTPGSPLFDHVRRVAQSREILYLKKLESGLGDLPTELGTCRPRTCCYCPLRTGDMRLPAYCSRPSVRTKRLTKTTRPLCS
jgi:hypothetical protein